ncbi:MAG: hypothetical protein ACJA1C_001198 [Crocinitomicaceae bacterium]|jgi:hypothetical protein
MENYIEYANNFIKNELKPHMKSKGFKVSGQFFYIETEDFIKYICLDKSSWNHKTTCTFSFRTSIFDKISAKYLKEYVQITKIPHNTTLNIIQTSVRAHIPQERDRYTLDANTDLNKLTETVFYHLDDILIPYIEQYKTKVDLLNMYKNPPRMYLGPAVFIELCIGLHEMEYGDKKLGIKHVRDWIEKEKDRGYWTEMVDSIAERLENDEL